ncbi:MAG: TPM domain-containing protein [Thermoguttaceae bacterium]|jgi:hypothetical protein
MSPYSANDASSPEDPVSTNLSDPGDGRQASSESERSPTNTRERKLNRARRFLEVVGVLTIAFSALAIFFTWGDRVNFDAACKPAAKAEVKSADTPILHETVTDLANMMSLAEKKKLNTLLAYVEKADSTQIVVLTVPSLNGSTIYAYSMSIYEANKIGKKGNDNGVLFLVAKAEHEIRIGVGRGLESKLTDLAASRILNDIVVPYFKAGRFDAGFDEGTTAIVKAVHGEFKAD